ncbi:MAG: hypothetical protein H7A24_14870 [Leptospiraceae bacterium]|nr:hypothetical protein [Leptospiraceae bacterium]MCP5513166.1 hypothetical protein [Leptospiraceae bacterium]
MKLNYFSNPHSKTVFLPDFSNQNPGFLRFFLHSGRNLYSIFLIIFLITNCQTSGRRIIRESSVTDPEILENPRADLKPKASEEIKLPFEIEQNPDLTKIYKIKSQDEWHNIKEGFISGSTYQLKVTSLKINKYDGYHEAMDVAKRKAIKNLTYLADPYLSPEGKIDIKILVEESGSIVAHSDFIGEKYFYVYQVKRPALKIIVEDKIK